MPTKSPAAAAIVAAAATRTSARLPLSRERVLDAAMALADADGIEGLTMRRLAKRLGVEAMSIYHYAASKDEILGAIVDRVVREIELPSPEGDWGSALRGTAISAHQVLRRHPWACNLLMSGPQVQPARLRMIDAMLERLAEAKLPGETADLVYHALDSHILGFTLWEAGYTVGLKDVTGDFATIVRELGLERYPHLMDHAAFHLAPRPGVPRKGAYEFGLDLILDGVDRAAAASA